MCYMPFVYVLYRCTKLRLLPAPARSKKDKSKGVVKADTSDPEPEGLTLLVPDIQRTAEIVHAATTSLRQANQGGASAGTLPSSLLDASHALPTMHEICIMQSIQYVNWFNRDKLEIHKSA